MRRPLLVLWLSSVVGCAALLGVDLDPVLQLPDSAGEGGAGQTNVTADGCVRSNCDSLGVACGSPDDGCGGTLSCTRCVDGCTPSNAAVACTGRCGAVGDGCGGFHDCGAAACGDAGAICFEGSCCKPVLECGDACGVTIDRGCGLGALSCPGPGSGDSFVCFEGKRCQPATCGAACDTTLLDGCGGSVYCPAPSAPAVCYQNEVCFPESCFGRCDGQVEPGCGQATQFCSINACQPNECCTYQPDLMYSTCSPNPNPALECMLAR